MARRILLADDSVTAQNMGRRILHDAGYEVTTVNNGSAALKKIAEQKPDLIILDVYMPGYGGLEVCSRLKENRDTQRIPVLLTVGKLEPFKPEEARRVRADAYVVKPFEASELLAALTKLEDKIVPGPEPYKPGRFAKAMAAAEEEQAYGDKETGWKNRLIIPGKKMKQVEAEPEPESPKSARRGGRDEDFRPVEAKKEFERPMPVGLPADISAEEIAAIAAAAAKINGKSEEAISAPPEPVAETKVEETAAPAEARSEETAEAVVEAAPVAESQVASEPQAASVAESQEKETPAATFASAAEEELETRAVAETPSSVEEEKAPATSTPEPEVEAASATEVLGEQASEKEEEKDNDEGDREKRPVSDAEVLAALASLTPAGGDFSLAAAAESAVASSIGGASLSGPRWIAEAVALSEEESTLILEHEMEKAYAAFAAAEAGRALLALPAASGNGNGNHPIEKSQAESTLATEAKAEVKAELKAEEAPPVAPQEPVNAVARETLEGVQEEETKEEAVKEEAFAAAASAGMPESGSEARPVASTFDPGGAPGSAEDGSVVRDAELAAAWANWRHIRESIVGEQAPVADGEPPVAENAAPAETVPQTEEPAAEEKQETAAVEETKAEPTEAPAAEAQDPAEISSIVDNMLAELKPKLMEELKRKLKK